jgi:hypothetical protein
MGVPIIDTTNEPKPDTTNSADWTVWGHYLMVSRARGNRHKSHKDPFARWIFDWNQPPVLLHQHKCIVVARQDDQFSLPLSDSKFGGLKRV